ncbi:prenyltransferase/squalene oxidase repeat-containing protein [Micromonospora sp. CPCC 206060]|uniref:prenyltransferase/squalene oxidase repeat-containing protein n=1 Tax=Micromonospora sp. CPCC 206060 TaxID=3122406 RepID=UPI002FF060A9
MPDIRRTRLAVRVTVASALTAFAVTAPGTPSTAVPAPGDATRAAATWLAAEFADGALPGPFGGQDWGLTIDGLLALTAADVAGQTRQAAAAQLAAHVTSYTTYDDYGIPGFTDGGATAKLLFAAAAVAGADPTDFGGHDLHARTLDLIAGAGDQAGRILSRTTPDTGPDASNTFDQSFAVLGLARTGQVPQTAVDFLIRQQCAVGGFRLYPDVAGAPSPSCDAQTDAPLDVDTTAMAVQALLAAADDGSVGAADAARRGADWLAAQQHADGSFGGSGPTSGANANSTGLAGQALGAAGRRTPADRAGGALVALQLTTAGGGAASADAGAVAYSTEALTAALTDGISDTGRDQWRRATSQALLGLAGTPLGRIGLDPPSSPEPTGSPTGSPSPSGSPSIPPTPSPTPSATGSPSTTAGPGTPTPSAGPTGTPTPSAGPTAGGSGRLPTTGAAITGYALVALLLIGGGAVLLVLSRRRTG